MNKIKICFFIPSLNVGGAEKMMIVLANHFAKNDSYSVSFIILRDGGKLQPTLSETVKLVVLNKTRVLLSIISLSKAIDKIKPDVLLSALGHANVAAVISRMLSRHKAKIIISERSTVSNSPLFVKGLIGNLNKLIYNYFYIKSDGVIAISEGVKADLIKLLNIPEGKITVIYNPAYPKNITTYKEINIVGKYNLDNKKILISVGRLEKAKDFITLLKAVNILINKNIFLVILGDGSERDSLERFIKNNRLSSKVVLPGFVKDPYSWLLSSDLYICSSAWEGFGNSIVEAMACGLPVVSTNCPGPKEILGDLGEIVPVGDEVLMAKAILSTLEARNLKDFEDRAKCFSIEKVSEQYLKVLI